jgi:FdhD protein
MKAPKDTQSIPVAGLRYDGGKAAPVEDCLAVEAVLQVQVNGEDYVTTVRTPGDDRYLVQGLLFTEQVISWDAKGLAFKEVVDPESGIVGCVDVSIPEAELLKNVGGRRSTMASASCGLCGIKSVDEIHIYGKPLKVHHDRKLHIGRVASMLEDMQRRQPIFKATGGCHGGLLFSLNGDVLSAFEDIGRHNAVDKAIGWLLEKGALNQADCLVVSGRLSYEIVYKAYHGQIPFLLSVSAPSSFAVEMAERFGMTIISWCRGESATVYSNVENVLMPGN